MKIRGIAHRGYSAKYLENTLLSFRAAYELNFSHVELDVHLSKDGIPVIIHDKTLNRTTDGMGFVNDYSLSELKRLTVGGEKNSNSRRSTCIFKRKNDDKY